MNNSNNSNREQQLITWTQIISDCKSAKASGTKVKDYLKANNISKDTYYYWYKEVKDSFSYVSYSGTNNTTFPATPSPSVRPSSSLKLSKDRERNRKLTLKPLVNSIRPFTIGRKNYLFCESVNGAKASTVIYSIIETAKANGLHVHKYLEFLKRNAKLLSKNLNSFFKVQLYTKSFGGL